MSRTVSSTKEQYISRQRFVTRWHKLLMVLSCVVVFCTTYALILPAITMEELSELTEPERTRVESVMELVAALPDNDAIAAALADFEAEDNSDGYDAYLADCVQQAQSAYAAYEELSETEKAAVENSDKLLALSWLYEAETLAEQTSLTVYAVDEYDTSVIMLRNGKSGYNVNSGMSYLNWYAIIVEENSNGQLYVSKVDKTSGTKNSYSASTDGGFVLLTYGKTVSATEKQYVTVSFDYKNATEGTKSSGYGTITFSDRDNSNNQNTDNNLTTVESASTKDFIELNLYDYGTNINDLYKSNKNYPGFQQDNGQQAVGSTASSNFGNNITEDLAAGYNLVTSDGNANGNKINMTQNYEGTGTANTPVSDAMSSTLGADGYPALSDGTSLSYLFSQSTYATKKNTQNIDGLFKKNQTTGEYSFNSRENHAQFDANTNTFTLYNQIISSNAFWYPFGNFLPFNDIVHESAQASTIDRTYIKTIANSAEAKYKNGEEDKYNTLATVLTQWINKMDKQYPDGWTAADAMNEYFNGSSAGGSAKPNFNDNEYAGLLKNLYSIDFDEETDFYFGMEMKMNFFQPQGGLTGNDGQQPMVFYFTGDDDVWVYIDGVLFLDLSGIHRHVGGEIDFVNGEVKYYYLDVSTGDVSTQPYKTVQFSDLVGADKLNAKGTFEDYSSHSFNLYYMERGAGSGVCRMNFNFPLLKKDAISVTKKLDSTEKLLGDPDFKFQILKEDGSLLIEEATEYTIYDSAGNPLDEKGEVGANGVFTLKAGQTAAFEEISGNDGKYYVRELLDESISAQYGDVKVDGTVQTKDGKNITINEETFTGVNSPTKTMSSEVTRTTVFEFTNTVDKDNLGSLSIEKVLTQYSKPPDETAKFDFEVKLDDKPLLIGTTYTVGDDTRTVETEGIISLEPGETAVISNILAGTSFSVQETAASQGDYHVSYELDGATVTEATGTIGVNARASVTVNNSELAANAEIPIQKTLANPDGDKHTYSFTLTEVNADGKAIDGGHTDSLPVAITNDPVTDKFTVYYPYSSFADSDLPKTFYYRVTEDTTSELGTVIDSSAYIVTVTLSKNDDGVMTAKITKVTKNGLDYDYTNTGQLSFVNRLASYELPETGGTGTLPCIAGGLLLIFGALLMYYKALRRKEDGSSP